MFEDILFQMLEATTKKALSPMWENRGSMIKEYVSVAPWRWEKIVKSDFERELKKFKCYEEGFEMGVEVVAG